MLALAGVTRALTRPTPVRGVSDGRVIVDAQGDPVRVRNTPGEIDVFSGPGIGPYVIVSRSVAGLVGTRDTYDELVSADPLLRRAYPGIEHVPRPLSLHGPEAASTELLFRRDPRAIVTVPWAAKLFAGYGLPALSVDLKGNDKAIIEGTRMQAEIVGDPARGAALIARYRAALTTIAAETKGLPKPRTLAIATEAGNRITYYDRPLTPKLFAVAGAAYAAPKGSGALDPERLLALDPEVIILLPTRFTYPQSPLAAFLAQPWSQGLQAVRARRVYAVPPLFVPLGGDIVQLPLYTRWLAELVHPQALQSEMRRQTIAAALRELRVTPTVAEIDRALAVDANGAQAHYTRFKSAAR